MFEVFLEGDRPQQIGRQYVTFVDFPVLVPVKEKGIYIKRCRLVVDVTDRGLPADAAQEVLEEWATTHEVQEDLQQACWEFGQRVSASTDVQKEALAWFGGIA